MKIQHFLQLIRYKNLLMIAFVQVLFSVVLAFNQGYFSTTFDIVIFFLLIQTTVLLAAAGNIINDFFDIEIDKINKPNKVLVGKVISGKSTLIIYYILNFFGIISGIGLAYFHDKIIYGLLFILISILLYYYSKYLKKIALLGNFIVSIFIALSIVLVYVFSPFDKLRFQMVNFNYLTIFIYALLAFLLNFIREIVKDIEDVDGDYSQGMKTLPILIGKKRTQIILFYLSFIPFIAIILLISISKHTILIIYSLVFLIIPLGYFMYKIKDSKSKKEIHKLSTLLKIIMLLGILSIIIFI